MPRAFSLVGLAEGAWRGPYRSAYGLHIVRLTGKEEGGLPKLAQIRSAVTREWSNEQRLEANDRFYHALRARYSVEIRLPTQSVDAQSLAAGAR